MKKRDCNECAEIVARKKVYNFDSYDWVTETTHFQAPRELHVFLSPRSSPFFFFNYTSPITVEYQFGDLFVKNLGKARVF